MVTENLWPSHPSQADETTGTAVVPPPGNEKEGEVPASPEPPVIQESPYRLASQHSIESLEDPFRSSQPAPIHWAVGWADLMMTMFLVFLVMYLYPSTKKVELRSVTPQAQDLTAGGQGLIKFPTLAIETPEGPAGLSDTDLARLAELIRLRQEDAEFSRFAAIDLGPDRTVRIVLADDLLFPVNKADLRLIAKNNIKKISELLQEIPHRINVVGHTDDQLIRAGQFATNWELSVMRATAVARFLIEEMGVSAARITVSGKSFYQPQVANTTPANRAKNRRVEIIVSLDPPPLLPLADSNILSTLGE